MQYALIYIDFFVNNIQKNHHLTAVNGDFIIVCVTFFYNALYRTNSISTLPPLGAPLNVELANSVLHVINRTESEGCFLNNSSKSF